MLDRDSLIIAVQRRVWFVLFWYSLFERISCLLLFSEIHWSLCFVTTAVLLKRFFFFVFVVNIIIYAVLIIYYIHNEKGFRDTTISVTWSLRKRKRKEGFPVSTAEGYVFLSCGAPSETRMVSTIGRGLIRVYKLPIQLSEKSMWTAAREENMATSQHEGHANQLDLLIKAGNVTFMLSFTTTQKLPWMYRSCFLKRVRCCFVRVGACWSNGGQSGSDHLG